jgi:predicted lipid-binding transport protein (Tim44 family)
MRFRGVLALGIVLVLAGSVLAQGEIADPKGLRVLHVLSGLACCFVIVMIIGYVCRGIIREFLRGQKYGMTLEEELDAIPKKRQATFKGEKVPDWKIMARQKATKAALKFLSCTDNWFEKKYVADVADEAFRLVKDAIEVRSMRSVERRVTPDCLVELTNEIKKLRQERELHIFGRVEVTDVDVLHFEAPVGKENHTFTALISAKSRDFYEDDETGELLRGDKKLYVYQEFWSFRRSPERWLVELIRPSSDVESVLEAKNVMAQIDLEEFAKDAEPEYLKEFVAR